MRCSVVFGITLRLLVINISSSSPAINTTTYYQRCVTTCGGKVAVVYCRLCWQHLACCSINSRQLSQMLSQNCHFCLPNLHSTPPLGGFPSEYCHPVWYWKTRMVWLPDGEIMLKICLFILTECMNIWWHKPCLHSIAWLKLCHKPAANAVQQIACWSDSSCNIDNFQCNIKAQNVTGSHIGATNNHKMMLHFWKP